MEKRVYICLMADIIHPGNLNVIQHAAKLGEVTVGLLTDRAISRYSRIPSMTFEQRKKVVENIKGVSRVIPQDTLEYDANLRILKPDYVVHGDDWQNDFRREIRKNVIKTLQEWKGELVEIPFTKGISQSVLSEATGQLGTTPEVRINSLRRLISAKPLVRVIEAHSGLTALIVENTSINEDGKVKEFDGMWLSSLTDSTMKGKPDIEYVDLTSRTQTLQDMIEVTTKPIIFDGDTGGLIEHFVFGIKTLERLGVSAIIIEDKIGLKKNSLFGTDVEQTQDTIEHFSQKIRMGKQAQITQDFMIIARIESLILKKGVADALERAKAYIDAGADGIMIHSKEKTPDEILAFCAEYKKFPRRVPLVAVPSTYSAIYEKELEEAGVNIVIYANQLCRSAYPAMTKTAETILKHERAKEADEQCMPIKEILRLIPDGM